MARTIAEIQRDITNELKARRPDHSDYPTTDWQLWIYVVAATINIFEVILDKFRSEVSDTVGKIAPGTARWYADQCKRFQNGHELLFNEDTVELYYAEDDTSARVIEVVAITEYDKGLSIKVAKLNEQNKIAPLSVDELRNFTGYMDSIKFAGIQTSIITTEADKVRYDVEVFFNPAVPEATVHERVLEALYAFRSKQDFNSVFYRQRFTDAIMDVDGVVTVDLKSMTRRGATMTDFVSVGVADELDAGYFDYDTDQCNLSFTSTNTI